MTETLEDLSTEFIISRIERAEAVQEQGGLRYLSVDGYFFSPQEQITLIRFGYPESGLITAERYARPDLIERWPDSDDAKLAGFRVKIPLKDGCDPALDLRLVASFADGFEVLGTFLVAVEQGQSVATPSGSSALAIGRERRKNVTRALYLPLSDFNHYLGGGADQARAVIETLNSVGLTVSWGVSVMPQFGAEDSAYFAPGLEVVWGLSGERMLEFFERQLTCFDTVWVEDSGHLRLITAALGGKMVRPRVIFKPSIDLLDALTALRERGQLLISSAEPLLLQEYERMAFLRSDSRVTPLALQQWRSLLELADLTIVDQPEHLALLQRLGCNKVELLPYLLPSASALQRRQYQDMLKKVVSEVEANQPTGVTNKSAGKWHQLRSKVIESRQTQLEKDSPSLIELMQGYHKWQGQRQPFRSDQPVDLIIPIYNALRQTRRCIESVINNSDLDFNLILVNDNSTDPAAIKYLRGILAQAGQGRLRHVMVLDSKETCGFAASINSALLCSKNDLVLLNSDTVVPQKWLSRLIGALNSDQLIASVTPLSNSASICSFDLGLVDSEADYCQRYTAIDQALSDLAPAEPFEIPTAVGFCMAISKKALKDVGFLDERIFSPMYGEENDWSMRAKKLGYKNVLLPSLYVYHEDGVSINSKPYQLRQEQLRQSEKMIDLLYPNFRGTVEDHLSSAERKTLFAPFFRSVVTAQVAEQPGVLVINNRLLGGGSQLFLSRYLARLSEDGCRAYVLEADQSKLRLIDRSKGFEKSYQLSWGELTRHNFKQLLSCFRIDNIFVNQLYHSNHSLITSLLIESGVPYDFMLHDYYSACPTVNLLNWEEQYCQAETNLHNCSVCLSRCYASSERTSRVPAVNIGEWRRNFGQFLESARHLLVPSETALKVIKCYYPQVRSRVFVYSQPDYLKESYDLGFADSKPLCLAIIGAIGRHKGEEYLYRLHQAIKQHSLPIKLKVIGYTSSHNEYYCAPDGRLEIGGAYAVEQISQLLQQSGAALVLDLSIWPETYCFTVDEALYSGYPVLSFGLGAAAERIELHQGGWILPEVSLEALLAKLKELLANRESIKEKSQKLQKMVKKNSFTIKVQRAAQQASAGKSGSQKSVRPVKKTREIPYWI